MDKVDALAAGMAIYRELSKEYGTKQDEILGLDQGARLSLILRAVQAEAVPQETLIHVVRGFIGTLTHSRNYSCLLVNNARFDIVEAALTGHEELLSPHNMPQKEGNIFGKADEGQARIQLFEQSLSYDHRELEIENLLAQPETSYSKRIARCIFKTHPLLRQAYENAILNGVDRVARSPYILRSEDERAPYGLRHFGEAASVHELLMPYSKALRTQGVPTAENLAYYLETAAKPLGYGEVSHKHHVTVEGVCKLLTSYAQYDDVALDWDSVAASVLGQIEKGTVPFEHGASVLEAVLPRCTQKDTMDKLAQSYGALLDSALAIPMHMQVWPERDYTATPVVTLYFSRKSSPKPLAQGVYWSVKQATSGARGIECDELFGYLATLRKFTASDNSAKAHPKEKDLVGQLNKSGLHPDIQDSVKPYLHVLATGMSIIAISTAQHAQHKR